MSLLSSPPLISVSKRGQINCTTFSESSTQKHFQYNKCFKGQAMWKFLSYLATCAISKMEQIILTIWQTSGTGTQETCSPLQVLFGHDWGIGIWRPWGSILYSVVGWNWTWKDQMTNIELQVYMWFEGRNKMGSCCSKSCLAMFRKKKDPTMPREPNWNILNQIRFPFKKQKGAHTSGAGSNIPSRDAAQPPSRWWALWNWRMYYFLVPKPSIHHSLE